VSGGCERGFPENFGKRQRFRQQAQL